MFDELKKYKNNGHFFFNPKDNLAEVCNAPTDKGGLYLIYALKNGRKELVYIGRSGKLEKDGGIVIRKTGLGGIRDRIVNGHHLYSKMAAKKAFPKRMLEENIEALDIYWYITLDENNNDNPILLKKELLKIHAHIYGLKPKWNRK